MCTLALYFRQFENYPLVIAANRDEHFSRATAGPQIWPTNPRIAAGKDLVAGGTWLGRSEEHTSELQSLAYLVCRLLLEKMSPDIAAAIRSSRIFRHDRKSSRLNPRPLHHALPISSGSP